MALISRQQYQQAGQPQASAQASSPYRQAGQPQASMQASTQQQASPFKAPDMSAYAQPSGGYNAYNVPRTPPKGAQQNDLSGNVPSNQMWAQAYNQASNQYGGNTQAQSWTMPGSSISQSYNPATGQYGQATSAPSNAGNMAYLSIDSRPAPIQATATGIGGNQMPWQDTMSQREAFAGNLSQRLGQYSGGQLTGPVTFDPSQLMQQANDQLAKGTFSNPFSQPIPQASGNYSQQIPYGDSVIQTYGSQQNLDTQRAMRNAEQYMQGNFQNPFGNIPQANNTQPSWDQQSYNPYAQMVVDMRAPSAHFAAPPQADAQFAPTVNAPARPDYNAPAPSGPVQLAPIVNIPSRRTAPSVAQATPPPSQGTPYDPQAQAQGLPDVPAAAPTRVRYGYRAQRNPVARPTQAPQPSSKQSQLDGIDNEINQWERATYGTRTGSAPPAEWYSHIQALQRLRTKAAAGDAAALAWSPKMKAPPANVTPIVPVNRRGRAARFGSMRQNGDNRR